MDNEVLIARAFVNARRHARSLPDYPGIRPVALAEAYSIQDPAIAMDGRSIAGWKVGRIRSPLDHVLGTDRLAGPIFADQLYGHGACSALPIIADGFAAAEAEFCLRIGRVPERGRAGLSMEDALAMIDAVHVGIEIASSPYPGINADGPLVTISDYGNNYGLLIGDEVPDWRSLDFLDWPVASRIDDADVGRATARDMLDGPVGAVAFLVDCLTARGLSLTPGQWVSSGAVTGVHVIRPGQSFDADFGELRMSCTIDAARAVA